MGDGRSCIALKYCHGVWVHSPIWRNLILIFFDYIGPSELQSQRITKREKLCAKQVTDANKNASQRHTKPGDSLVNLPTL